MNVWIDKRRISIPIVKLQKDFIPVVPLDAAPRGEKMNGLTKYYAEEQKGMQSIADICFENIKKIKDDASYIPQASAINEQVKSIINVQLAKVKTIQALK